MDDGKRFVVKGTLLGFCNKLYTITFHTRRTAHCAVVLLINSLINKVNHVAKKEQEHVLSLQLKQSLGVIVGINCGCYFLWPGQIIMHLL